MMADVPLHQLLVQLKLTAYEQGLTDAGHDKFEQLVAQCQDNEAELLSDLVNDAKMKKPKAKKLIFALRLQENRPKYQKSSKIYIFGIRNSVYF